MEGTGEQPSRGGAPPLAPETPCQVGKVGEGSKKISQCSGALGEGTPCCGLQEAPGTLLISSAGGSRGHFSEWSRHAWLLSFMLLSPGPTQPVPSWVCCPVSMPLPWRVPTPDHAHEIGEQAMWAQHPVWREQRALCLGPHHPGQQACVQLSCTTSWPSAHSSPSGAETIWCP